MSANSSDRVRVLASVLLAALLAGCVTSAEQTASQRDLTLLARTLKQGPLSNLDPEAFQSSAREMVKTPIEFYGQVLSESGNPLKGAIVKPTVFDRLADPFEFPYFSFTAKDDIVTNNKGRFKITGIKGAGMYVLVEVPGWQPITAPRKLFVYADGLNQTLPFPTQQEPALFQFERRPPGAELKPIHTGALQLEDDGAPLELALREVAPYGVEPGTGEAQVTCGRSVDDAAPDAEFDWWCEFTIPGGGVQPFMIDMDRAPEDGYVETVRFGYDADDERWDDRDDRDLIVRFADGHYGSVTLSMRMDGDFYVAVDGIWNPSGSNWLD